MKANLDNKVTYDELNDVVKNDFKNTQSGIIDEVHNRKAEDIKVGEAINDEAKKRLDKYEKKKKEIEEYAKKGPDNRLTDVIKSTDNSGEVFKVRKGNPDSLFGDDNFRSIKVVVNDKELQEEMGYKPIRLKDVFNTWYRYTHFYGPAVRGLLDNTNWGGPTGQNLWGVHNHRIYLDKNERGWYFDPSDQSIHASNDTEPVAGFISPTDFYTNYFLRTRVDTGWDDDNLMLIAGYYKDPKGVEHTLSVARGHGYLNNGGGIDTTFWWGLIYDMGNPTQDFLVNLSPIVGHGKFGSADAGNAVAYITLIRTNSHLECRTTDWSVDGSDTRDVPEWTFTYDIPETKPDDMPYEEYHNIKMMLEQTNRVGFGERSGQPWFSINKQYEIFDDGDIYALHTDTLYRLTRGKRTRWIKNDAKEYWKAIGSCSSVLPNRIFLYNPRMHHFYFYYYKYKWRKIIV